MTDRVVTFGETMALIRALSIGSLQTVSQLELGVGGAESNVAIGLTRLGAAVTWIGRVGADSLGDRVLRELRGEGVDVRAVIDPAAQTGIMLKEHRTNDVTRVTYYRAGSAGSRLSPADLMESGITDAALLHLTGITPALSESAAEAVNAALDSAESAGVPVSFDVNHRPSLWVGRDSASTYRAIAARSTIVFAGVEEARILIPGAESPVELARGIAGLGPQEVVIKLGAHGAVALVDGVDFAQPAVVIRPIDTVGAGDAFVAGYLAEYLRGLPVPDRLVTAVTTGAFACLNPADWEGFARRDELGLLAAADPVSR